MPAVQTMQSTRWVKHEDVNANFEPKVWDKMEEMYEGREVGISNGGNYLSEVGHRIVNLFVHSCNHTTASISFSLFAVRQDSGESNEK